MGDRVREIILMSTGDGAPLRLIGGEVDHKYPKDSCPNLMNVMVLMDGGTYCCENFI